MKLMLQFGTDFDVVSIPMLNLNLKKLKNDFLKWIYNKEKASKYWSGDVVYYRADAFVDYVNQTLLLNCKEKAKVIASHLTEANNSYPLIVL